jgi:hypothetical protein
LATSIFTRGKAYPTTNAWEGVILLYHRQCFSKFTLSNKLNVSRDINPCWAGIATRGKGFELLVFGNLIQQRSCRANFNAGPTKLASRFFERRSDSSYTNFTISVNETKSTYTLDITDFYTAEAANA